LSALSAGQAGAGDAAGADFERARGPYQEPRAIIAAGQKTARPRVNGTGFAAPG
jgi:hypothetical protein